ncbi:MAG: efflux RND transporter periplasmic adaptor subunit [Rubrivivax sp.]
MTRTRTWTLATAAALALAALLTWAFTPGAAQVELAVAASGPFETGIDEEGRTRLRDRYVVSAPLAGRLARLTLREGDLVRAGDGVALLQPLLPTLLDDRARLEQQARVSAAGAAAQAASAREAAARVALEVAQAEWRRTEGLVQQGFVSPLKADADRLAEQAARREAQAAAEMTRAARFELEGARVALSAWTVGASAEGGAAAARLVLRSPVAGRVLKLHHPSEGTVAAGAPVLEVGDVARLEVVAELLTTDALQVRPGSVVRIERWGGAGVLAAQVRRVEPAAFTKVSALGVEEQRVVVVIDFTGPPEQWAQLGDGYRVGVRVLTRQAEQALRIPVGAVFPRPAGMAPGEGCGEEGGEMAGLAGAQAGPQKAAPTASQTASQAGASADPTAQGRCAAVFVEEGGHAHLRAVRLEARNDRQAWVAAGLRAGERVVVYPPSALREGARVRARNSAAST